MMNAFNIATEAFNTKQASQLAGVTEPQLRHWDKQGLLKPSISQAAGRGSRRLYSYTDLLALKTIKSLRDYEVSLQKIRKCVLYLRRRLPDISNPLHFCVLLAAGETVYLVEDEAKLIDTIRQPGQHAMIEVMIDALDRELRSQVMTLASKRMAEVSVGDEAYQVEVEPDAEYGGYTAEVAGLPGCITQGDTMDEVMENAVDAIECYLAAHADLASQGIHVAVKRPSRSRRAGA